MKLLLGVTGSVASILTPELLKRLKEFADVRVAVTDSVKMFWRPEGVEHILFDEDDYGPYSRGDEILHIELKKWADVYVIAPLSANSLAKLAHGLADNLVTNVARAWPVAKPLVLAPAMNTDMWEHPATAEQMTTLTRWFGPSLHIVPPICKRLACGDEGMGAMASLDDIVEMVQRRSGS